MRNAAVALTVLALVIAAGAADKSKPPKGQVIDSGSFGIFVGGRRVATEKFEIQQRPDMSVTTTELTPEETKPKVVQSSELQLAPNGDVLRYHWREIIGNKATLVVEPAHEFLVEHITATPESKTEDAPFLMPHSTAILDDYSFAHRQILAWRYLAAGCSTSAQGKLECNLSRSQFGVLIPQQRLSIAVWLELAGREKVTVRGAERELTRINLTSEGAEWSMWFDDSNKLVRVVLNGENTEVVRD